MTPTKYGLDPIAMGLAINTGLLMLIEKAQQRNAILGENYPIYPEDSTNTGAPNNE